MRRFFIPAVLLIGLILFAGACTRSNQAATAIPASEAAAVEELPTDTGPVEAASSAAPTTEAAAEATPAEGIGGGGDSLVITQQSMFVDQFNRWQIVGEVRNDTPTPLTSVELLVEIQGPANTTLFTDVTSLLVPNIAPGGVAPFIYTINDPTITPESAIVTVTSTAAADITPVTLDIANAHFSQNEFNEFHCTGEIVNNSGVPVDVDGLAAAVLDSSGALVSADWFWAVAQHLEPGESSPFRASPIGPAGEAAQCRVYVDARQADSVPGYAVQVLGSSYYRDIFDTGHLVGEVRNDSAETLVIQLVAGMYDAEGRVIDADTTSIPISVAPGETAAYDFSTLSATNYSQETATAFVSATVIVDSFWTYPAFTEQTVLVVDNFAASLDEGSILVTGDVVNNQTFMADFIVVALRFRDPAGAIVAQGNASVFEPIPPGASAPFDIRVYLPPDVDPTTLSPEIVAKTDLPE